MNQHNHQTAPTQFVEANGIRFAYRRFGKARGVLHCGLYEDRERRGQAHLRSLDPREEMAVQAMTDVVLKRLNENEREEPA